MQVKGQMVIGGALWFVTKPLGRCQTSAASSCKLLWRQMLKQCSQTPYTTINTEKMVDHFTAPAHHGCLQYPRRRATK